MTREPKDDSLDFRGTMRFYSFAYLRNIANGLSQTSEQVAEGAGQCRVASVIFWVFAFEAQLNHIGKARIDDWQSIERKLDAKARIKTIAARIGTHMTIGTLPLRTLWEAAQFRNALAHGKTIEEAGYSFLLPDGADRSESLIPDNLRKYETIETARLVRQHAEEVMRHFNELAGFPPTAMRSIADVS